MPIAQIKTTYGTNNAVTARRLTYIHADHLNTPRLMTDANKTVVWKWHSDAYGMVAPNANPDGDAITDKLDLRFAGQIADAESGLYYNMHRYYDPMLGRYTQSDPIGLEGGLNTYGYVGGNPLLYADPTGLSWTCGYNQSNGHIVCHDDETGKKTVDNPNCYSGKGDDKNKPDSQNKPFEGPIPRGEWGTGSPYDSKKTGPLTIPLIPRSGDTSAGGTRDDNTFRMHGRITQLQKAALFAIGKLGKP